MLLATTAATAYYPHVTPPESDVSMEAADLIISSDKPYTSIYYFIWLATGVMNIPFIAPVNLLATYVLCLHIILEASLCIYLLISHI